MAVGDAHVLVVCMGFHATITAKVCWSVVLGLAPLEQLRSYHGGR